MSGVSGGSGGEGARGRIGARRGQCWCEGGAAALLARRGGEAKAEVQMAMALTWVVEMLDKPVLENRQCLGVEVAFLPPVQT